MAQALTPAMEKMLASIPDRDNYAISTGELCHTLSSFKTLHALERRGLIHVEYDVWDSWVSRA